MKSQYDREPAFSAGKIVRYFVLLAAAILDVASPRFAHAQATPPSLSEMARLEAEDHPDPAGISSLLHGYIAFGLGTEAASLLVRRIRLGSLPLDAAVPLFEKVIGNRNLWEDLAQIAGACEAAERIGVSSPMLLYSCGTAMRMTGRMKDASQILARIGPGSPYHLHALISLGQISVETGDFDTGLNTFKRVVDMAKTASGSPVYDRARRAQAELLLLMGRTADAGRLLAGLPPGESDLAGSVGTAMVAADPSSALENLPAERIAAEPRRVKVLFLLLKAGIARHRGRFASAVADLTRADEEIHDALSGKSSLSLSRTPPRGAGNTFEALLHAHASARQLLASRRSGEDGSVVRDHAVDLLMDLLLLDRYAGQPLPDGSSARLAGDRSARASGEIEPVLNGIERFFIEGIEHTKTVVKWDIALRDVDRFVDEFRERTGSPGELGRTIRRDRLLLRLEKGQAEVLRLHKGIRHRWEAEFAGVDTGEASVYRLLRDFGLYLNELDGIRTAISEAQAFASTKLRRTRRRNGLGRDSREAMDDVIRYTLSLSDKWMAELLPSLRYRQDQARIASREREKRDLSAMRPLVRRHLADALIAEAWSSRRDPREDPQREYRSAVMKAAGLLAGEHLTLPDRLETAINIGFLLAGGLERWEPFPGRHAGEWEKKLISTVLPILEAASETDPRREKSRYLIAILGIHAREKWGLAASRSFLEEFPGSPFSGDIAVRLGHEELKAGKLSRATALYRAASGAGNPAAHAVARYMLGWIRFRSGDAAGALRELGPVLADTSFRCAEPAAFERDLLSLSVDALRDSPLEDLASFTPVAQGRCGGRSVLVLLAESESGRGDGSRAVAAYDALARRYTNDGTAPSYKIDAIRELVRAERYREGMSRALALQEKYVAAGKTATDLARLLHTLSDRMFAEGVRSGDRSAFSLAAQGIERYFTLVGMQRTGSDEEMLLKRATALLRAGERKAGIRLLKELQGKRWNGNLGERAALLYAETMIAGYERKEQAAEDADEAALFLLRNYPSEKAAGLVLRAVSGFLGAEDYVRAARTAEEIEKCNAATKSIKSRARLIQAEVAVFRNDPAAARKKAALVLEDPAADATSRDLTKRAKELSLLATLREIEGKTTARDWKGAGELLEMAGNRFVDRSETPRYYLSALRSYRQGGHEDAALAIGLLFLREFPGREETVEVVEAIGPYLQARNEFEKTAEICARVAEAFPRNPMAPGLLFHAARISEFVGNHDAAMKQFSAYRSRYSDRRWMSAYAGLAIGEIKLQGGDTQSAIREMEEALRQVDAGLEPDAPKELSTRAGYARIAIGESRTKPFRAAKLVAPLEKSLAAKEKLFLRALAAFERAEADAPLEVAVQASRLAADLFVDFGKSILDSQRPKGMSAIDRANYEEALKRRARVLFEKAVARYAAAYRRLDLENGLPELAVPIRNRRDEVLALVSAISAPVEEGTP